MLTIQEKVQCVFWCHELKSQTAAQSKFRYQFGQDPAHIYSIKRQFKIFWKMEAFWMAKCRVGKTIMKRLLMLCV